jgi:hypothetical protein
LPAQYLHPTVAKVNTIRNQLTVFIRAAQADRRFRLHQVGVYCTVAREYTAQ